MKKLNLFPLLLSTLAIAVSCLLPGTANAQTYICSGSTSTNLTPDLGAACIGRAGGQISSFSMGVSTQIDPVLGPRSSLSVSDFSFTIPLSISEFYYLETMISGRSSGNVVVGFNSTKPGPNSTVVPYNITLVLTGAHVESVQASVTTTGMVDSVSMYYKTLEVIDNSTSPATTVTYTNPL